MVRAVGIGGGVVPAAATKIDSGAMAVSAVGVVESVTCTVKSDVAAELGVPVITPLDDRASSVGSAPVVMVHEYGAVPPEATRLAE